MKSKNLLVLAGLVAVTGCSSGTGKGLTVSASARSTPVQGATAAAGNTIAAGNAIDAHNGILITRIRVVVARAEVEGAPACPAPPVATPPTAGTNAMSANGAIRPRALDWHGGGGSPMGSGEASGDDGASGGGEDDGQECELKGGPFLIDLSGAGLTGGVQFVVDLPAPAGTYDELKLKIDTVSATQAGTDAGLLDMADAHASIRVDGTMDGTAFTFSTPLAVTQSREGALVVDPAKGSNVTLDFDASGWFEAADGSKLDPSSPVAQGAILANIRDSFRLVSDDDHDGQEDGDGHGQGGGGGSGD
jgi:hypothetical protein